MRCLSYIAALVTSLSLMACGGESTYDLGATDDPIYYGTRDPENVSLSAGQKLAIGWFYSGSPTNQFCSGTLISPTVVASAEHCLEGVTSVDQIGFGVGLYPSNPTATFDISAVYSHDSLDAALFELTESATARVASLSPIPANRDNPGSWLNQKLDAAGYGQTHDDSTGRYFAGVWLEGLTEGYVEVDGRGAQGICFGDSGGPLLAPGPVVVAVESTGSESCVGEDLMTRLDVMTDFIDEVVGGGGADDCGDIDYLGRCDGAVAEWCENGTVQRYDCAVDGQTCGYVNDETGYWCVDQPTDNCGGVDYLGRCVGGVAQWCEDGELKSRDCGAEGMDCAYVDQEWGYYCVARDDDSGGNDNDNSSPTANDGDENSLPARQGCQQVSGSGSATAVGWIGLAALLGLVLGRRRSW